MTIGRPRRVSALVLTATLFAAACAGSSATPAPATPAPGTPAQTSAPTTAGPAPLTGLIKIDGSSTVYPITEAVAEDFQKAYPGVKVTVAFSGTGGGFKKFCAGETDANDASRPYKPDDAAEGKVCATNGIVPVQLTVAYDGLSVLVNKANTWVACMTTAELKSIFDAGSKPDLRWSEVRAGWPDETIVRYGPGDNSGTFDYFSEVINGEAKKHIYGAGYNPSEDDNQLVQGVAGTTYSIGYFGFAYYEANQDKLKLLAVDKGAGCVTPAIGTIKDGSYSPLSRPLFVYPSVQALKRPEVAAFFEYYLANASALSTEVGYIPLPDDLLAKSKDALAAAIG